MVEAFSRIFGWVGLTHVQLVICNKVRNDNGTAAQSRLNRIVYRMSLAQASNLIRRSSVLGLQNTNCMFDLPEPLNTRARQIAGGNEEVSNLIKDIVAHFNGDSKRRKLDAEGVKQEEHPTTVAVTASQRLAASSANAKLYEGVSVSAPVRKKCHIIVFDHGIDVFATAGFNETTSQSIVSVSQTDIYGSLILEEPDKPKGQWQVVIIGRTSDPTCASISVLLCFKIMGADMRSELEAKLKALGPVESSSRPGMIRVTAYRGSKEGVLYLLEKYIFFGFSKPMVVLPLSSVVSVSYSTVTQKTFNLVVESHSDTIEFAMISHEEYGLMDQYIQSHDFTNNSLSEERKAKTSVPNAEYSQELPKAMEEAELKPESSDDEEADADYGSEDEDSESSDDSEQEESEALDSQEESDEQEE